MSALVILWTILGILALILSLRNLAFTLADQRVIKPGDEIRHTVTWWLRNSEIASLSIDALITVIGVLAFFSIGSVELRILVTQWGLVTVAMINVALPAIRLRARYRLYRLADERERAAVERPSDEQDRKQLESEA